MYSTLLTKPGELLITPEHQIPELVKSALNHPVHPTSVQSTRGCSTRSCFGDVHTQVQYLYTEGESATPFGAQEPGSLQVGGQAAGIFCGGRWPIQIIYFCGQTEPHLDFSSCDSSSPAVARPASAGSHNPSQYLTFTRSQHHICRCGQRRSWKNSRTFSLSSNDSEAGGVAWKPRPHCNSQLYI
jgi:hypothetical protein